MIKNALPETAWRRQRRSRQQAVLSDELPASCCLYLRQRESQGWKGRQSERGLGGASRPRLRKAAFARCWSLNVSQWTNLRYDGLAQRAFGGAQGGGLGRSTWNVQWRTAARRWRSLSTRSRGRSIPALHIA